MGKFKKHLKNRSEDKSNPIAGKSGAEKENLAQLLSFNFKQLDTTQGQTFEDWHKENLLVKMLDTLKSYSTITTISLQGERNNKFKNYDRFPPKSEFRHPAHVPADASWASMHIQGKECVAGHIFKNVFYIVFLDKDHKFWPSSI